MELISSYSKVVVYKINIQKSIPFLCTSNKQIEFGINKIPFTLALPKNEILRYKSIKMCTRSILRRISQL